MNSLTIQFLKNPLRTGAIWPSSPALSRRLVSGIGLEEAGTVVELGPGTGAITEYILPKLDGHAKFFAVELNRAVIFDFQKKFPEVKIYNDSASNLGEILTKEGIDHADAVLSGLPWASFPDSLQDEILNAIVSSLPEGGVFATFAYLQGTLLPAAHHFRRKLSRHFSSVRKTEIVWRNIPPAFCYHCRK